MEGVANHFSQQQRHDSVQLLASLYPRLLVLVPHLVVVAAPHAGGRIPAVPPIPANIPVALGQVSKLLFGSLPIDITLSQLKPPLIGLGFGVARETTATR